MAGQEAVAEVAVAHGLDRGRELDGGDLLAGLDDQGVVGPGVQDSNASEK